MLSGHGSSGAGREDGGEDGGSKHWRVEREVLIANEVCRQPASLPVGAFASRC